jgi:hypothetical protein
MRALPPVVVLLAAAGLAGCRSVDVRSHFSPPDALGRPKPIFEEDERTGAWRWRLDTARLPGPGPSAFDPHPGGLRVSVVEDAALPGDADSHQAIEGHPIPLPVSRGIWPNRPYASPATFDPIWVGAEVCVDWVVALEPRGSCAVLLEAAPRLTHATGCVAVLTDLRVRRVVGLGETLVLSADVSDPAAAQAGMLVGFPPGQAGSFAIRVRD